MQFMLLIYLEERALNQNEREECYIKSAQVAHDLHAKGQYIAAAPLEPVASASSVRVRNGKAFVTEGPFAETREQLGGYFMVEAESAEQAIEIAKHIPGAQFGTVEVRPVIHVNGMPEESNEKAEHVSMARP